MVTACSVHPPHPTTVSVLEEMSSADTRAFPRLALASLLLALRLLCSLRGCPSCFTSGELLWGRWEKGGEEAERKADILLSRRLYKLVRQSGQQLRWVIVSWPNFAAKVGSLRVNVTQRRDWWETGRGWWSTRQPPQHHTGQHCNRYMFEMSLHLTVPICAASQRCHSVGPQLRWWAAGTPLCWAAYPRSKGCQRGHNNSVITECVSCYVYDLILCKHWRNLCWRRWDLIFSHPCAETPLLV